MKPFFRGFYTSLLITSVSFNSYAFTEKVKFFSERGEKQEISGSIKNLKFGTDKDDGESISKVISLVNAHKNSFIHGNQKMLSDFKLNFKPDASKDAKIFVQGNSASVRLYQSLNYRDKEGKTHYVPFEGAEINTYVSNLEEKNGRYHGGKITSINSSMIDPTKYEHYKNKFESFGPHSYENLSLSNRTQFINQVKDFDLKYMSSLYPNEKFENREDFLKRAFEDKQFVVKFLAANTDKMELIFVRQNNQSDFRLAHRLSLPFGSDRIIDLNIEHKDNDLILKNKSIAKHVKVNIYTGSILKLKMIKRRDGDSVKWKDKEVKRGLFKQEDYDKALINLSKVVEYFKGEFSWNSYDNQGSDLDATVRYKGSKLFGTKALRQNAAWIGAPYNQFLFGAGGDELGDFLEALDVIGHEYFHAVISRTSNLDGGGETGALNEHLADIMGVGFEAEAEKHEYDFKIGEKTLQKSDMGLRDFLNPGASFSEQASSMDDVNRNFGKHCVPSEINDECGVHYSNGVVNKAVALAIKDFGWEKMKNVIFDVATKRLRSNSDFLDYKNQVINSCEDNKEFSKDQCDVIAKHFAQVGITESSESNIVSLDNLQLDNEMCSIIESMCKIVDEKSGSFSEMCKKCGLE